VGLRITNGAGEIKLKDREIAGEINAFEMTVFLIYIIFNH
jgi:hypothetical protein